MTSLMPRSFYLPELVRFLERPFGDGHAVRIEHYLADGKYVVRAELPGVDPDKDVTIAVDGEELSITAERAVEKHNGTHSEFAYGTFARTIRLPAGAVRDEITASYVAGILEVTVPVRTEADSKRIEVKITR